MCNELPDVPKVAQKERNERFTSTIFITAASRSVTSEGFRTLVCLCVIFVVLRSGECSRQRTGWQYTYIRRDVLFFCFIKNILFMKAMLSSASLPRPNKNMYFVICFDSTKLAIYTRSKMPNLTIGCVAKARENKNSTLLTSGDSLLLIVLFAFATSIFSPNYSPPHT